MRVNLLHPSIVCFKSYFNLKIALVLIISTMVVVSWHVYLVNKIDLQSYKFNKFQNALAKSEGINSIVSERQKKRLINNLRIRFVEILNGLYRGVVGSVCFERIFISGDQVVVVGNSINIADLKNFISNFDVHSKGAPGIKKMVKNGELYSFELSW